MIRVAVADDQALVRMGLCQLLGMAPGIEVVGEAEDGESALAVVAEKDPDVLLLDVRMPKRDGLEVLRALAGARTRCVILTTFPDDEVLIDALRAGAAGFLLKDSSLEELVDAIEAVQRGESAVQPVTLSKILPGLDRVPRDRTPPPIEALSAREKEILRLLAAGLSNHQIATALDNAEGTIKNHVSRILAKLGVRDRTQAVLRGIEQRLI